MELDLVVHGIISATLTPGEHQVLFAKRLEYLFDIVGSKMFLFEIPVSNTHNLQAVRAWANQTGMENIDLIQATAEVYSKRKSKLKQNS